MFKKLVCSILIGTSLICGVGCNQSEQKIEPETNFPTSNEAKVEYEIGAIVLQESSNSTTLNAQIKEWLIENPNAEILYMDYEVADYYSSQYSNRVMIVYRIAKENK